MLQYFLRRAGQSILTLGMVRHFDLSRMVHLSHLSPFMGSPWSMMLDKALLEAEMRMSSKNAMAVIAKEFWASDDIGLWPFE